MDEINEMYQDIATRISMQNNTATNNVIQSQKKRLALMSGKSDVYSCSIEILGDIKNYDFLKIYHYEHGWVLCQVINITRQLDIMTGIIKIIGYRKEGILQRVRKPFSINAEILIAEDSFIEQVLGLNKIDGALLGTLEHHDDLQLKLDLRIILQRHVSILAKSGAGKSYTVGVLLEEMIKKGIPVLVLDPHSEYHTLKYPNLETRDLLKLKKYKLEPQGFEENIIEYSPDLEINTTAEKISLDIEKVTPQDLMEMLPKLSPTQQNLLMTVLSNVNNRINLDEIIFTISNEESNTKWSLISAIEQIKKKDIFTKNFTPLDKIIQYNKCSILSLKGVEHDERDILVSQLLKQLFEQRKKGTIPPFFLVVEEAHTFIPEKGAGTITRCSKILRTIAGEGRKFGLGLCIISQRPAKVEKNVLSQCGTQIIMKVTNPNDLKAIMGSCEGIENNSMQEISQLNIGTCMLTGINETPLKVNVRPRISKHGGESASINLK